MEILAAVLTSLLGLGGAPGFVIDKTATDLLRGQLFYAEQLEVRVDNTPNFQILQGRVDRIRVAGRGVYPLPILRIQAIDLETDPISINPATLQSGNLELLEPAQAAVRVVVTDTDLTNLLRSPIVTNSFQGLRIELPGSNSGAEIFDLINPEVKFLGGDRIRVTTIAKPRPLPQQPSQSPNQLSKQVTEPLAIAAETGIRIVGGTRIELSAPRIDLQGVSIPDQITNRFIQGLNRIGDLRQLEARGITARVLKFEVTSGQLQLIGFASMKSTKTIQASSP